MPIGNYTCPFCGQPLVHWTSCPYPVNANAHYYYCNNDGVLLYRQPNGTWWQIPRYRANDAAAGQPPDDLELIPVRRRRGTTTIKNLCPSCYHIHGTEWKLVKETGRTGPFAGGELFYCNSCRQEFEKIGNKLVPVIRDTCKVCGEPLIIRRVDTPGAHTNRIYSFVCPRHGPWDPTGLRKVELAEQDYLEWKEYRKREMKKKLRILKIGLVKKVYREHTVYNPRTRKYKIKMGHKTDFRNQLEDVHQLLDETSENIDRFGMANVSAEKIRKDKKNQELVDQAFIKARGLSHKDTERFSKEEQEEYGKSQEEISNKAKVGRIEKEEKKEKEKREKKKATPLGRFYDPFDRFAKKVGHSVRTVFFSLLLLVVGIAISATLGNVWFIVAFIFWSFYTILPDPEENKMVENSDRFFAGSFLATKENRTNTGIAFLKAILKVGIIVCFMAGLYTKPFPMSNMILLLLGFGFYFSMPVEFEPTKPYEFILSFFRVLLGVFIAIFVFGAFGGGIFQSRELGWLTLAFFVVFPVATERESLARALGKLGSGSGQGYEMIDKIIFLFIMIMFIMVGGGFTFAGGFFIGTAGIVFSAVWVLGLVAGLTTPAETRPWMGAIILIIGFFVFGLGAGQQAFGTALFGQWWPAMHNTVTEFMKPVGEIFQQFQQTFGQGWLMFTNPVGYAKQIAQGTYAENPLGPTGAYGLEMNRIDVQSIYLDEPFMVQIELENKGVFDARDVRIEIYTTIPGIHMGTEVGNPVKMLEEMKTITGREDKYKKPLYFYVIDKINHPDLYNKFNLGLIMKQDARSIFLIGRIPCDWVRQKGWKVFADNIDELREMYMPFTVNITYKYKADSTLQIDFMSTEEWGRLSRENRLARGQKPSIITTAPVSLNLGTTDQPVREDFPFFVGFNLTSGIMKNREITEASVSLLLHKDFGDPTTCKPAAPPPETIGDFNKYTFDLSKERSKSGFCSYFTGLSPSVKPLKVPKKTYTISAESEYRFGKWEEKDTLINFMDVCGFREEEGVEISPTDPGGPKYCEYKIQQGQGKCNVGEGGCRIGKNECIEKWGGPESAKLICGDVEGIDVPICCYEDLLKDDPEECKKAYDTWMGNF